MNRDIEIKTDDIEFNYRVAIIIKNDNKILVQKDNRVSHLTLPGGRCTLGESSAQTGIRELKEEMGLKSEFVKSVGMIENFYTSSFTNKKMHEILMINELKFLDKKIYQQDIIKNIEENKDKKEHLTYVWMDLKKLETSNFKPEIILSMIDKNEFQHYIYNVEK